MCYVEFANDLRISDFYSCFYRLTLLNMQRFHGIDKGEIQALYGYREIPAAQGRKQILKIVYCPLSNGSKIKKLSSLTQLSF